jgi:putative transposase
MPRKPRFNLPGVPQHVVQRGNNREPCFLGEGDYRRYLDDLRDVSQKSGCQLHAYVLMTNHVHLLITPETRYGIGQMMQALGRRYVYFVNHTYRRTGTLWEGRYKASLIDSEPYLLICMRYIELNPVRAGMVRHPGEYGWSSYAANAQGKVDPLITRHAMYLALDSSEEGRQRAYRELFRHHMDHEELHSIRDALNHELVLGRSHFKDRVEAMTRRQARQGTPGRPRAEEEAGEYSVLRERILEENPL